MQSAWAAALTSLIFVSSYWVPVLVIDKADGYYFTDTVSYIMFHAFVTIIYICFTFLAERYPRVLAHRNTVNVSLYLAVIGVVILFWSGYSTGQFTPLLTVLGSLLYLTGVYYIDMLIGS